MSNVVYCVFETSRDEPALQNIFEDEGKALEYVLKLTSESGVGSFEVEEWLVY